MRILFDNVNIMLFDIMGINPITERWRRPTDARRAMPMAAKKSSVIGTLFIIDAMPMAAIWKKSNRFVLEH